MVKRNEHSRDGAEREFDCKARLAHFSFDVGPFMGRYHYKGNSVHTYPQRESQVLPNLPQRIQS